MSIFSIARQTTAEENEETAPIFQEIKKHKQQDIIPPLGIAKPELVKSFLENIEDEDKIKIAIQEAEEYEKESGFQTAKRRALSHSARFTEGLFGGFTSLLNKIIPDLELGEETENVEKHPPRQLPETPEFREFTKSKTGKFLEPRTEKEKTTQEVAEDIGSMFSVPGLGFWSKVLLPVGGQITKQAIKASGGSEFAQDMGKLGFITISSIAGIGNAPRVAAQALTQAENMIPQGLRFSSRPTEQAIQRIKNSNWFRTGRTASKGPAMDELTRIEGMIQNGTIDAHDAMQLRRDISEARKQLGGFQWNPSQQVADKKQARYFLDRVDEALLASMENYGKNVNPKWWKNYNLANQAFATTRRSRQIADFVERHAKPLQSQTAKTLFHVGAVGGGYSLPVVATLAGVGIGAAKSVQIINRMIRSPVLRNHYLDVLRYAATGNSAAMNKSLKKFDITAERLEKRKEKD